MKPNESAAKEIVDDARWRVVLGREVHGEFYYGVSTTGIYCRPACPSRRPSRRHVVFFDTPRQAEAAGFRPCRRCRPAMLPTDRQADLVRRACALLDRAAEPVTLKELGAEVGSSPGHLQRVFTRLIGVSPKAYAATVHCNRLRQELIQDKPILDAVFDAGYASSSRAYAEAGSKLGMSPKAFKSGAAGLVIRHAVAESELGLVLVAATPKGICCIEFGDSPEALLARLRSRFPLADLIPADEEVRDWIAEVVSYIHRPQRSLGLPLDVQGTAFQHRVWKALQAIPLGSVSSYSDIAAALGNPKAVRAVAQACAANPVSLAVPCHRVIGKDGSLTGYRWGTERKQALLERERATASDEESGPSSCR